MIPNNMRSVLEIVILLWTSASMVHGEFRRPSQDAAILSEARYLRNNGQFGSAYTQEDGVEFKEESDGMGNRKGSYSYIDPSGLRRTVTYTAGKDGFRAAGDDIPVTPLIPSASGAADYDDPQYDELPTPYRSRVRRPSNIPVESPAVKPQYNGPQYSVNMPQGTPYNSAQNSAAVPQMQLSNSAPQPLATPHSAPSHNAAYPLVQQNSPSNQNGNIPSTQYASPSQNGNIPLTQYTSPPHNGNIPSSPPHNGNIPSTQYASPTQNGNIPLTQYTSPPHNGNIPLSPPNNHGNIPSTQYASPPQNGNIPLSTQYTSPSQNGNIPLTQYASPSQNGNIPSTQYASPQPQQELQKHVAQQSQPAVSSVYYPGDQSPYNPQIPSQYNMIQFQYQSPSVQAYNSFEPNLPPAPTIDQLQSHRYFPSGKFSINRSPDGYTYTFSKD